jgi:hypothetical protein
LIYGRAPFASRHRSKARAAGKNIPNRLSQKGISYPPDGDGDVKNKAQEVKGRNKEEKNAGDEVNRLHDYSPSGIKMKIWR